MDRGRIKISYIIELFGLAIIIAVLIFALQSRSASNTHTTNSQQTQDTNSPSIDVISNATSGPADDDQDGLSNSEEASLGTDPKSSDSDNDGLSDYDEVKVYKSDPIKSDTDGDGIIDVVEYRTVTARQTAQSC